jgi:hypothetical protein
MSSRLYLKVARALRVAVAGTILGASGVVGLSRLATVESHLGEVDGTIETAAELGHVDGEGELLVDKLEGLVAAVRAVHQVETRANILAVRVLSHECECRCIAGGRDTVGTRVVGAVEGTVLSASRVVRAKRCVPLVTGVAVSVAGGRMEPAPVGVEHKRMLRAGTAAATRALLEWLKSVNTLKGSPKDIYLAGRDLGVGLSSLSADLLGGSHSNEGESDERGAREHVERPGLTG